MSPLPVPEGWVPEFPSQRPPFLPGNEFAAKPGDRLALKHGAYSDRAIEPVAAVIRESILASDDVAFLRAPHFAGALRRHVRAAARVELLEAWVDSMPIEQAAQSDRGQISPLELLRKWQTTADNSAGKLGLDATSWARIRKDYAIGTRMDLASLLSQRDDDV